MDHEGHPYTQSALARVLGISDQAVRDIENKDAGMDHDRRHFLSGLFGIPPLLFGIITLEEILKIVEQQRATTGIPAFSPPSWIPHKATIDKTDYHEHLVSLWNTHHSHTAHRAIADTLLRIDTLYREFFLVSTREWPWIQESLCEYHQFVAHLLRDQQKYNTAIEQMNKAYQMARILQNTELTALVLHRRGNTLCDAGRIDEAVRDYEKAKQYEEKLPRNLHGSLLLHAGLVGAKSARSDEGKQKSAIALIDRGGWIVRDLQKEEDPYFLKLHQGRYHLDKGIALIAIGQNKDALNELNLVKCGPGYLRRQAYSDILQAQAHVNLGEYSDAARLAENALLVFQEINSVVNIARVEKIYQKLKESPYKNNPDVPRLDYLLHYKSRQQ